ncbi:hypothetical protein D3C84_786960 [compost metagenome]
MNTPSKINQLHNNCGATQAACRESTPRVMPRKPLPASPMKIRAGGKFQNRNPATAAASNIGVTQAVGWAKPAKPNNAYNNAPPRHTQMASTLAMPSMPSIKLYRFSSHTKYTAASTWPSQPNARVKPNTFTGGKPPSQNSAQKAAAKCPSKRQRAAICP